MILVTVGYQMSFDRLVGAVDAWASTHKETSFVAQIGPDGQAPEHMDWVRFLEPDAFRDRLETCDAIVAHAGMGSILMALQYGKPILVMPRRGDLRETRNDHQLATAKKFAESGQILVAMDETEFAEKMSMLTRWDPTQRISAHASPELIRAVREFIHGG